MARGIKEGDYVYTPSGRLGIVEKQYGGRWMVRYLEADAVPLREELLTKTQAPVGSSRTRDRRPVAD